MSRRIKTSHNTKPGNRFQPESVTDIAPQITSKYSAAQKVFLKFTALIGPLRRNLCRTVMVTNYPDDPKLPATYTTTEGMYFMSELKFFTDELVVKVIIGQLQKGNIDVVRYEEVGMKNADDSQLREYATERGYVLLSMDDDITRLYAQWRNIGKQHTGIFYAPMAQSLGARRHWGNRYLLSDVGGID